VSLLLARRRAAGWVDVPGRPDQEPGLMTAATTHHAGAPIVRSALRRASVLVYARSSALAVDAPECCSEPPGIISSHRSTWRLLKAEAGPRGLRTQPRLPRSRETGSGTWSRLGLKAQGGTTRFNDQRGRDRASVGRNDRIRGIAVARRATAPTTLPSPKLSSAVGPLESRKRSPA
jgi:hypothetical protein